VIVSAPGYTTVERTVDVPSDGTAQINGGLGRPLGFVEPPSNRGATVLLGFDAGTFRGVGIATTIYYGYRAQSRRFELGLGTQIGAAPIGVGFAAVGRGFFVTGRVRPYVELQIGLAGATQSAHAAGGLMLADLPIGRAGLDLFIEAGIGAGTFAGERHVFIPILAGFSTHLIKTP
jgi:hypothetical protein